MTQRPLFLTAFRIRSAVLLLLGASSIVVLCSTNASAATYYVNSGGLCNDANTGLSSATSWCSPPGTRTISNSGFLRTAWGGVNTLARIQCGDTILLRGGATYNSAIGGAWRIDSSYYASACAATSPITITVATSAEWTGSSGHFTFDATGISGTSPQFGPTGACGGGGFCGVVDVEAVSTITIGGRSTGQRFILQNVTVNSSGNDGGLQLFNARRIDARWFNIGPRDFMNNEDQAGAINTGQLDNSIVHNILIDRWTEGPGVQAGLQVASRHHSVAFVDVTVRLSGIDNPNAPNQAGDAFQLGGGEFVDTMGGGGGIWCIRCSAEDVFWPGTDSGGNGSGSLEQVYRYREFHALGAGRTNAQASVAAGFQSAGDNNCTGGDNQLVVITHSSFYSNRFYGFTGPHGGGLAILYNNLFYRGGQIWGDMRYDRSACNHSFFNNIVKTATLPWYHNTANLVENVNPLMNFNLYDYWTSGNDAFSTFRFTGPNLFSASGVTFNNAAAQSGFTGPNDKISTSTVRYDPKWTSLGGNCNRAFVDGGAAAGFADCNFNLQPGSPAIDAATFFLRANGAGTNASTITVRTNGQVGGHSGDPRVYFVEPSSFWRATGDTIEIEGCGSVQIGGMTATTITFTPACSWSDGAGIHLPWTGARPDMGPLEFGVSGTAPAAPRNLRTVP